MSYWCVFLVWGVLGSAMAMSSRCDRRFAADSNLYRLCCLPNQTPGPPGHTLEVRTSLSGNSVSLVPSSIDCRPWCSAKTLQQQHNRLKEADLDQLTQRMTETKTGPRGLPGA